MRVVVPRSSSVPGNSVSEYTEGRIEKTQIRIHFDTFLLKKRKHSMNISPIQNCYQVNVD